MPTRWLSTLLGLACGRRPAAQPRRAVTLDDHSRVVAVADPQRSPEGDWVAYTVTTSDAEKDRRDTDIWMARWDGTAQLRLTSSPEAESSPRWSPDGRYLAFVAARGTDEEKKRGPQIWLLDRAGGEAQRVSDVKGGVSDIQWSPTAPGSPRRPRRGSDAEPEKKPGWERKTAPPIVIDRYRFKQDREGYLGHRYDHIGVFDLATRAHVVLTTGRWTTAARHGRRMAGTSPSSASARTPSRTAPTTPTSG